MPYTYEELRSVALDLLSGRERATIDLNQFGHLSIGIAEVLQRRGDASLPNGYGSRPTLNRNDQETVREVFWELFRQGIITLGMNTSNEGFPWFKVSHYGEELLNNEDAYFFHDVSSYEQIILEEIPDINDTTLLYLKEAMQAFRSGCLLSSTVMLGVAAEHSFQLLLETISQNHLEKEKYKNVFSEAFILGRINKFKSLLDQNKQSLPRDVKEDLDTHFAGIQSVIRSFRNEAGHPTGKIIQREQVYVLLNLFISYCKKLYRLKEYFSAES